MMMQTSMMVPTTTRVGVGLFVMLQFAVAMGYKETSSIADMGPLPDGPIAPPHPALAPKPYFNWARIPTSFHGARKDSAYSDAEVARLAKFQVLAIEKWYTPCGSQGPTQSGPGCAVEYKMAHLFNQTKAITPNQTTIMYWNTMLDFSMYEAHAAMEASEARGVPVYLRDIHGEVISLCNDGNVYCNITTFDWTQPAARAIWIEAITNLTATGLVDGIYADHSSEKGVGIGSNFNFTKKGEGPNQLCNGAGAEHFCYNFTYEFAKSFNSWHYWSTNYSQDLLSKTTGGPVIAGPLANMGLSCKFADLRQMQEQGPLTMIEANCGCQPKPEVLIQFLAAAEKYTYMHCMGNTNETDGGTTVIEMTTWPEMDYALGEPDGPAVEVPTKGSNVWHRTFASGAWVTWDDTKQNGSYYFPGHPPYPNPPL
eukprot:m.24433 g.24433  ORF g.24433 m.24433 type:complete len:425 (+) comp14608_c0_seq1:64-1338(+)